MELDTILNKFMNTTRKSKLAVIIPLFGYQKTQKNKQLDEETFKITLDRTYSTAHQAYFIFVGDDKSVSPKIRNLIMGKQQGGNCIGVHVPNDATYPEYITEGLRVALEDTDAEYILNVNPWVVMQHGVIDTLVDRVNVGDDSSIVCGYDLRTEITPDAFDDYKCLIPKEEHAISFNALAMKRYTAEVLPIDKNYKTRRFMERDVWQTLFSQGRVSIATQRSPIFSFDIDFTALESEEEKELDLHYFISKWGYAPALNAKDLI